MDPFSLDAQDAEQQHLLALSRQLVDPSPMQPANHDHLTNLNTTTQSSTTTTTSITDSESTTSSITNVTQSTTTSTSTNQTTTTTTASNQSNVTNTNSTTSSSNNSSTTFPSPAIPQKSIGSSTINNAPPTPGTFANITFLQTPGTPLTPMMAGSTGDPGIVPQLQNIVSTVNLGCKLDLKKIALHARNAEYNPKRFAAVIMRIREPRTTALIFSSGKMVCTGAKSEEQSRLAARKYARIVQKLGFDVSF